MMEELVAIASIGTSRKTPTFATGDNALGRAIEAIKTLPQSTPEAQLLGAVAIIAQYETCGRTPQAASAPGEAAADESLAVCSPRAGEILGQILGMTSTPVKDQLLGEWLEYASGAGVRAPWRWLPALLDYGASYRRLRGAIARAAGARGAWLMRQNPRWQFAAGEQEDLKSLFANGTSEQRVSAIARLRRSEPAAARELVAETWKQDAADDRAAFVAATVHSLSDADEAFLEAALDDRSKQVRAAAADLLARLPASAFVRRMIERATPLLQFTASKAGGLLRKGATASVAISLPPETLDANWARDGIIEKPEGNIGRRQWWLRQILAFVPLTHWSRTWGISPGESVAAVKGEFADVVLQGWHESAGRNPDAGWISALLMAAVKEARGPVTLSLLAKLPDDARHAITAEIFESAATMNTRVIELLHELPGSLDRRAAGALFRHVEGRVNQSKQAGYQYVIAQILQESACRVPPVFYDELVERWTGDAWEPNRKARDEFFQILMLRRDLQREMPASRNTQIPQVEG